MRNCFAQTSVFLNSFSIGTIDNGALDRAVSIFKGLKTVEIRSSTKHVDQLSIADRSHKVHSCGRAHPFTGRHLFTERTKIFIKAGMAPVNKDRHIDYGSHLSIMYNALIKTCRYFHGSTL